MNKRHRIFLVEDHPIFRQGLTQVLTLEPDLAVCGNADSATQAKQGIAGCRPDLVLVDVSLADGDGIELVKDLKALYPKLPLLVLSMHDEVLYAERALRAGALGYVMKRASTGEVLRAIRLALAGEIYVSADIKNRLVERRLTGHWMPASLMDSLTDRELEVYRLSGEGLTTTQIARHLKISPSTVDSHRAHIKEKLGLKSWAEFIRHAGQWVNQHAPR